MKETAKKWEQRQIEMGIIKKKIGERVTSKRGNSVGLTLKASPKARSCRREQALTEAPRSTSS